MRVTGKQRAFVTAYVGEANFNATGAAKLAGYRATSEHSFESIGSENLQRPAIKEAIDLHFQKISPVSAEECLTELASLARGSSKDKIRALALLSQHYGLLDGRWQAREEETRLEVERQRIRDEVRNEVIEECIKDIEKDLGESNREKNHQWDMVVQKYRDSPVAVEALHFLRQVMEGKASVEEINEAKTLEVEIIPPQRRLQPAAVERIMREV
jgi:phage terminase small subunit